MKLGELFNQVQGEPVIGKTVDFRLIKTTTEGQESYKIKGIFRILTELDRRDAHRRAEESLLEEYKDSKFSITSDVRLFEEKVWELVLCLYDPEDPRKRILDKDVTLFKKGLTIPMLNYLVREYEKFSMDEYPELITAEEYADLEGQAEKK